MSKIDWPFHHCPSCGGNALTLELQKRYHCSDCGLTYFHNVATGAGVMIMMEGRLLLLRRGTEPGKGLFTVPGGFVDPGESAEEAVARECREEIGLELAPAALRYLTSAPNFYTYRDIPYVTCDIFFSANLPRFTPQIDRVEAVEAVFLSPSEVEPALLAFPSTRLAWQRLSSGSLTN